MQGQQELGQILISGNGRYMGKQLIFRGVYVLFALAINAFFLFWLEGQRASLPLRAREQHQMIGIIIAFVVVATIIEIAWLLLKYRQTAVGRATKISVHEGAIRGAFASGFMGFTIQEMDLFYNTIKNVDIMRDRLVIHTQGVQYICYLENSEEVRNTIMNIMQSKE